MKNFALLSLVSTIVSVGSLVACAAEDVPIGSSEQLALKKAECPPVAAPACPEGQGVSVTTNESGCDQYRCTEVATSCPPVAAPPADWCGQGKTPKLGKNARGCDQWSCVSTGAATTCPPVAAPPADWCGEGVSPTLVKGADGCAQWKCPPVTTDTCTGKKCAPGSSCHMCPAPNKAIPSCVPNGASC